MGEVRLISNSQFLLVGQLDGETGVIFDPDYSALESNAELRF